jgi:hypothetical protein
MGLFRRPTPPWAQELLCQMTQVQKGQKQIMAEVQLDDSVLTSAAAAIESLVTAVNTFLASPVAATIPAADLTVFDQALTDAGTAQTALVAATPTPPAPSS